jgi:hypothetical protein
MAPRLVAIKKKHARARATTQHLWRVHGRYGVHHVYCWHGLPAYWGGVMPDSPALAGERCVCVCGGGGGMRTRRACMRLARTCMRHVASCQCCCWWHALTAAACCARCRHAGVCAARLVYPQPTDGISEVEPSLLWSPAVLAGGLRGGGRKAGQQPVATALSAVWVVLMCCATLVPLQSACLWGGGTAADWHTRCVTTPPLLCARCGHSGRPVSAVQRHALLPGCLRRGWSQGGLPGAPQGLRVYVCVCGGGAVASARQLHPSWLQHTAAWHHTRSPARLVTPRHSCSTIASSPRGTLNTTTQAGAGLVGSRLGGGAAAARRFQAALEGSIAAHFPGNHAINCMCHSSENFYR